MSKKAKQKSLPRIKVEYICDWTSRSGDDQTGHITITTPTGVIEATWECRGGMGGGADLVSNSTKEFTDEEAQELIDTSALSQGDGTYEADLFRNEYGWFDVKNIVWSDDETKE